MKTSTGLWIAGGVLGTAALAYGTHRVIKNIRARRAIQDFERGGYDVMSGKKLPKGGATVENKINLVEVAMSVATDLGTAFPAWDPRSYTENDDAVERALLKVPKPLFPELVKIYYQKYKRDLVNDLMRNLDRDNLDRVKYLFS